MKKLAFVMALVLVLGSLTGCCFKHTYSEATCTEPATCTKCGKTEGEPLGHSFSVATCIQKSTCSRCGLETGDYGDHDWVYKDYSAPSCSLCGQVNDTLSDMEKKFVGIWYSDTKSKGESIVKFYLHYDGSVIMEGISKNDVCSTWKYDGTDKDGNYIITIKSYGTMTVSYLGNITVFATYVPDNKSGFVIFDAHGSR